MFGEHGGLAGSDPTAPRVGWVIQEGGLFPHWTVEENVSTVPRLLGWPPGKRREKALELLESVGLPAADFARRRPGELSGGQRQRVGVARALAAEPRLVLMDEPFGALDPPSRRAIQEEFRGWRTRLRAAVLFVTHDVGEAFLLADRVAVLAGGTVRQVGTPDELRRRPVDELVRGFLAGNSVVSAIARVLLGAPRRDRRSRGAARAARRGRDGDRGGDRRSARRRAHAPAAPRAARARLRQRRPDDSQPRAVRLPDSGAAARRHRRADGDRRARALRSPADPSQHARRNPVGRSRDRRGRGRARDDARGSVSGSSSCRSRCR